MSNKWQNDSELFSIVRKKLFVALVGDVLDSLGHTRQFLSANLKPIKTDMVIIGRAMPVLEADCFTDSIRANNPLSEQAFGLLFEALDDLKPDEVYICSGSSPNYALWGGLMSTRAIACQAAGAVVNGYHRDSNEIERLGFPIASIGSYAQDQRMRGKVIDWRVPIEINGVRINNGDIIYGDRDGIVVVPKQIEAQVFELAFEKAAIESEVLKALQNGMSTVDAFAKFKVM